jgi:transposase
MIFKVRTGQMTATQAAQALGISRQRYYLWEKRGVQALLKAVEAHPKGRPKKLQPDLPKHPWLRRMRALEKQVQLYEQKERLRHALKEMQESRSTRDSSQKKTRNDSSDLKPTAKRQKPN